MRWVPSTPLIQLWILIVGFLLVWGDYPLILWVQGQPLEYRWVWKLITEIGEAWPWFTGLSVIGVMGKFWGKPFSLRYSRAAWLSIWNLLYVGTGLNICKWMIGRPRPKHFLYEGIMTPEPFEWTNPFALSFPSGHAQAIWSLAVCASLYWPRYTKYFITVAGVVALSRFVLLHHYLSDVMVGSVFGAVGSLWFHKIYAMRCFQRPTTRG